MPPDDHLVDLLAQAALFDLVEAGPADADLASAPVLDRWFAMEDPLGRVMLFGRVSGHPRLGDRNIHTSQIFGLDAAGKWARSLNRWYSLGAPFLGDGQQALRIPHLRSLRGVDEIRTVLAAEAGKVRALLSHQQH